MVISDLIKVGHKLLSSGAAIELVSGPGVGKTSAMRAIAANMSRVLKLPSAIVIVTLTQMEGPDLQGYLYPVKDGEELWARFTRPPVFPNKWNVEVYVDGVVDKNYAGPMPSNGIVFFDEFGQANIDLQKPTGQILLERRIGQYELEPGWSVAAASNRVADRSGVVKRLMFLQNRMISIDIRPSYPVWEDWAMREGIHALIISFAKKYPSLIFREEVPKEPGPFGTPRSLVMCGRALEALHDKSLGPTKLPVDHIAHDVVLGSLGEATLPVFISHLKLADELPEIEEVVRDPNKCRLPSNGAAQYIMAMTLAHHAIKKQAGAFIKYISRMHEEIQILFVTTAAKRNSEILAVPEVNVWLQKNAKLALIAFGG